MRIEGLTFPEAAERLAERAGLEWRPGPQQAQAGRERQDILRANEAAAAFYAEQLQGPASAEARAYLAKRGLSPEIIAAFRLGYAPAGWDNLLRHLAGKGFGEQFLQTAGLVKQGDRGGYYDVFRHRIIYPIVDVSARVIGFGGRALDPDEPAKYLNSPDTTVFKKGTTVYGLNLARPAIVEAKRALVVEGYMDVIALVQGGFRNVVACLGTATTEAHLHLLGRYAEEIIFVFDADAAGMRAALRSIPLFEHSNVDARIAVLPAGQDPDDCVRQGGPEAFQSCLDAATTMVEYQIRMAFQQHDPTSADGRLRAAREAVDILLKVRDGARREEMLERTADWWAREDPARAEAHAKVLRLELRRRVSELRPEPGARPDRPHDRGFILETVAETAGVTDPRLEALEREVLAGALSSVEHCRLAAETLRADDFSLPPHRAILAALQERVGDPEFVPGDIVDGLAGHPELQQLAVELRLAQDGYPEEDFQHVVAKLQQQRGVVGLRPRYELALTAEDEEEASTEEDFLALEKKVQEALNTGQPCPDIAKYQRLQRRFRGKGRKGFIEHAGPTPLGAASADKPAPEGDGPPGPGTPPE